MHGGSSKALVGREGSSYGRCGSCGVSSNVGISDGHVCRQVVSVHLAGRAYDVRRDACGHQIGDRGLLSGSVGVIDYRNEVVYGRGYCRKS